MFDEAIYLDPGSESTVRKILDRVYASVPRAVLTGTQNDTVETLIEEAEALHAVYRFDEARRTIDLAVQIIRAGPPLTE